MFSLIPMEFSLASGITDFMTIANAVLDNTFMGSIIGVVVVGSLIFFVWKGFKS